MPAPEIMRLFKSIESGGNPNARTGSYKGLYQLSDSEFNRYGGGDIYNPADNERAAGLKLDAEASTFKNSYGREPTPTELYLQHQQGVGGYAAHSKNPDAPAWENMASTAEGRQKGANWAKKAIWGNVPDDVKAQFPGGVDSLTSKQFMDVWQSKIDRRMGVEKGGGSPPMATQKTASPLNLDMFDPQAMALRSQSMGVDPQAQAMLPQGAQAPQASSQMNPQAMQAMASGQPSGGGLERGLNGAAVALMAAYNPAGAAALNAANKESWHTIQGADGQMYRINSGDGRVERIGVPAKVARTPHFDAEGNFAGDYSPTEGWRPAAGAQPRKAEDKAAAIDEAKSFVKLGTDLDNHATAAQRSLNELDVLEKDLSNSNPITGVAQGPLGPRIHEAKKTLSQFGLNPFGVTDGVAAGDRAISITNRLALELRNPKGEQGGMPGAVSNGDREYLKESVPGLQKDAAGNKQIIAMHRAVANRTIEIAKMKQEYAATHGRLDAGFNKVVRDYAEANPLFPKPSGDAATGAPNTVKTPSGDLQWSIAK